MRCLLALACVLCLPIMAEDAQPKKSTITERLEQEKRGELDDTSKSPAVQIDATRDRFAGYYMEAATKNEEKAVKAMLHRVCERIIERAEQRARAAQERLERAMQPRGKSERA